MFGRKLSTVALVGSLATAATIGACRDEASTGPSNVPSSSYAANLRLQSGDFQTGPVAVALPQALRVRVLDAGGTPVRGGTVNWSVISGGGSVNPPTGVSDANGLVTTTWTLGATLGANSVRAYLSNQYILDSATFTANATAGAPVVIRLDAATAPPVSARVASTTPAISYTVVDQFNFPVEDVIVTFTTGPNSGTVSQTADTSDAAGHVSTIWTFGTVTGAQTLSASIAGLLPVTFATTATPDTSRRIAAFSGSGQIGTPNSLLAAPIIVQVTDRFNNAIPNELVFFADSVGGGNVVIPVVSPSVTDATGIASATWRLGPGAGLQRIRVRTPGSGGQFARVTASANIVFRDVFAGNYFTCGITTNDRTYCWGFGEDGQLGLGPGTAMISRNSPSWPATVADTILGPFPTLREVSAGRSHTCGVAINRSLYCWGSNPDGRMFVIPPPSGRIPLATDISSPSGSSSATNNQLLGSSAVVSTGESFSCAATLAGVVLCAGNNDVGQVGTASGLITIFPAAFLDTTTQGATTPPRSYAMLATGERHGCAIPKQFDLNAGPVPGAPWCWGRNADGQLGNGTFVDTLRPSIITMPIGVTAFDSTSLVAGAAHSCILSAAPVAGAAFCWGSNSFGQLGTGGAIVVGSRVAIPTAVSGALTFVRLYAGDRHTCGLTAAGAAFCWGRNNAGQLGDGTTTNQSGPVAVAGGLFFRNLALGELHSCGITGPGPGPAGTLGLAGPVFCWGDNEYGQLGSGAFGANGGLILTPLRVTNQQ